MSVVVVEYFRFPLGARLSGREGIPFVFDVGQMTQETVLLSSQTGKSREPSGVAFLEVQGWEVLWVARDVLLE